MKRFRLEKFFVVGVWFIIGLTISLCAQAVLPDVPGPLPVKGEQ